MRRLTFLIFTICFAAGAYAQPEFATDGGSFSLGGNILSISSNGGELYDDDNGNRSINLNLNPDFNVFIVPSLSVGAEILVTYYLQGSYSRNSLGVGPALTYYIAGHKERRVYPYIGVAYMFIKSAYKDTEFDTEGDYKSTYFTGKAGVIFMLSTAVGLNLEYNYTSVATGSDTMTRGNQLYLGLGVKYYIF